MGHPEKLFHRTALATAMMAAGASFAPIAVAQGDLVLEEVIVTAQKREESIQDIAATVNVVSGDTVERFNTFSFEDVEQLTAGMSLDRRSARNGTIAMRGISVDPEAGMPSAVDTYWNDVIVRPDVAFTVIYDLERLEILRGPQGTLQGRTSPAGAINIITRKPSLSEMEGYVQGTAGDSDVLNGQFGISLPVVENVLGLRLSGAWNESDFRGVDNENTGSDSESEAKTLRTSLLWEPTDFFSASLVYEYLDREIVDNKTLDGTDKLGERPSLEAEDRKTLAPTDDFSDLEYDAASLIMTWGIGNLELTSVTGYTDSEKPSRTENDRADYITVEDVLTYQTSFTEVESFSQELRLSGSVTDWWDYMIGVYYLDQETDTNFESWNIIPLSAFFPVAPPGIDINLSTTGVLPIDSEELSFFTFNTFRISDFLQLEVGLRYQDLDRFRRADVLPGAAIWVTPPFDSFLDQINEGIAGVDPIAGISEDNVDAEDDAFTGSVTLRYDWTDDVSLYASYNRGYRPGSVSISPSPVIQFVPEDVLLYDEEESDAFEVGFKGRFLNGRAMLNGALYYQLFDGHFGFVRGILVNTPDGLQNFPGGLAFNGDAIVWGVELDGQMLVSENLSVGGALSYNNAEWDDAQQPCNEFEPGEVIGQCDIDGESVSQEPDWSFSLNGEYTLPFEQTEWYLRGLFKYVGERDNKDASAGIGPVLEELEEYSTVNLYTGLRSLNGAWDVFAWVKNVFDEDEITRQTGPDATDLAVSGGSYTQLDVVQERSFGVTGRYNF